MAGRLSQAIPGYLHLAEKAIAGYRSLIRSGDAGHVQVTEGEGVCLGVLSRYIVTAIVNIGRF